jgi:hypothetical protein
MLSFPAMAQGAARVPHYLVVVRAGETELFEVLRQRLTRFPYPTALIWDRRRRDRRVVLRDMPEDRRGRERRAPPDPAWESDGFLVAETDQPDAGALERRPPALVSPMDSRLAAGTCEPGASRQSIQRAWERAERLFALRRFSLGLHAELSELRAKREAAPERAGRPRVVSV